MKMMKRYLKKTQVLIFIPYHFLETIVESYIAKNTSMHRETLEMKGEPYRLYRARINKNGHKYKDMFAVISYE